MKTIPLGVTVEDLITGLKGVAVGRASWMYSCDSYDVQPTLDKDGKVPDTYSFDVTQLEIVERSETLMKCPVQPKLIVELGSTVKDPVKDIIGIVIGRCFYLNGCVRICIQPKQLPGKHPVETIWIPEQQAEIIDKSEPVKADDKKPTGGPTPSSTKIERY